MKWHCVSFTHSYVMEQWTLWPSGPHSAVATSSRWRLTCSPERMKPRNASSVCTRQHSASRALLRSPIPHHRSNSSAWCCSMANQALRLTAGLGREPVPTRMRKLFVKRRNSDPGLLRGDPCPNNSHSFVCTDLVFRIVPYASRLLRSKWSHRIACTVDMQRKKHKI